MKLKVDEQTATATLFLQRASGEFMEQVASVAEAFSLNVFKKPLVIGQGQGVKVQGHSVT